MRRTLVSGLESAMSLSRRRRASYLCGLSAILLLAAPAAYAQDAMAESSDRFGDAVARGDFNGDGYHDLAVGLPFEDRSNFPGPPTVDAGAVDVIYGTASGLQSANRQLLRQGLGGMDDMAEAGDHFGWALAAGDFNRDGFDDLAVGVPFESVGALDSAGAVHIIYGSALGLSATTIPDQFWHQNSPTVNDSAEAGDSFGYSLAAGSFDINGYGNDDDLAIGVPGEDADAGVVHVFYGSPTGLRAFATFQVFGQGSDIPAGIEDFAEPGDVFGWSLAAGDFNGDSYDDLAIGVPGENANAGAVSVLYSYSGGVYILDDELWDQNSPNVAESPQSGDRFGSSVTIGDFNGDGFADLAIGVPYEAMSWPMQAVGAVHVLYADASVNGLSAAYSQFWHGGFAEAESNDLLGSTLAAGDFNGDGYSDLAIGVPYEDVGEIQNAGAVNVLAGSNGGLWSEGIVLGQLLHQDSAGIEGTSGAGDRFASSLVAGDFNGDGRDDLAIGVPFDNLYGEAGPVPDAGAVNVIYGSSNGLGRSTVRGALQDQFWTQGIVLPAETQF